MEAGIWRLIAYACGAGLAVVTLSAWFAPGPLLAVPPALPPVDNPLGLRGTQEVIHGAGLAATVVLGLGSLATVTRLLGRLDITRDEERQQFKWVACGAALTGIAVVIDQTISGVGVLTPLGQVCMAIGLLALPVSVGVAILRYRLYAIDLILNRAAVYGGMTLILGLLFLVLTAASQFAVESTTGRRSDLLPVGARLRLRRTVLRLHSPASTRHF